MSDNVSINKLILLRYFSCDATEEEQQAVEAWCSLSDKNRKIAMDLYLIYNALDTLGRIEGVDSYTALKSVKKRLLKERKGLFIKRLQRIAAILFIPLLIGSIYSQLRNEPVRYMEVRTHPGMISSVELPDGSNVWLNGDSYLRYPQTFSSKRRELFLDGEAYFSVEKEVKRKFIVNTSGQVRIEVLGTEFNLDAYDRHENVTTTLVEGSVCMHYSKERTEECVIMKPHQKIVYSKESEQIEQYKIDPSKEIAWKGGRILLRDTPLMEVLWMLSKRFNVEFSVTQDSFKQHSFTGSFYNQDLECILEHLKIASNIKYRIEKVEGRSDLGAHKQKIILY